MAEHDVRVVGALPAAPVVREALEPHLDVGALVPLLELVRAGAGLVPRAEPVAELARRRRLGVVDVGGVGGGGALVFATVSVTFSPEFAPVFTLANPPYPLETCETDLSATV